MGIRVGTGQPEDLGGEGHGQEAHHHHQQDGDSQGLAQHQVGAFPVLLALAPGHNGGDGHVHGEEEGQGDELGLGAEAHGGDGGGPHRPHHNGIDNPYQGHQKGLQDGGPGDLEGIPEDTRRRGDFPLGFIPSQDAPAIKEPEEEGLEQRLTSFRGDSPCFFMYYDISNTYCTPFMEKCKSGGRCAGLCSPPRRGATALGSFLGIAFREKLI